MNKLFFLNKMLFGLGVTLLLSGCEKFLSDLERLDKVEVITDTSPIILSKSKVSIGGEIKGLATGKVTEYGHIWSVANWPKFGETNIENSTNGNSFDNKSFITEINNLQVNTTYYARAYAIYDNETIYGDTVSFRTANVNFSIVTEEVLKFRDTIEVFGQIKDLPNDVKLDAFGFAWSEDAPDDPTIANANVIYLSSLPTDGQFNTKIADATPLKNYKVRAFSILGGTPIYANVISFVKKDTWLLKPEYAGAVKAGFAVFVIGGSAYLAGGYWPFTAQVVRFTPAHEGPWVEHRPMKLPLDLEFSSSFVIHQTPYIIGGRQYGDPGQSIRRTWKWDFVNAKWEETGLLPNGMRSSLAFELNNKGYIVFGTDGCPAPCKEVYEYDPISGNWSQNSISSYPGDVGRRSTKVMAFTIDNIAYIGTLNYDDPTAGMEFYAFDPTQTLPAEKWVKKASIPLGNRSPVNLSGFSIANRGYVYFTLGRNNFWEYDPQMDKWTSRADFPGSPRAVTSFSINTKGYLGWGEDIDGNVLQKDMWEYLPEDQ